MFSARVASVPPDQMRATLLLSSAAAVLGHGSMNFPRPRNANPNAPYAAEASCIGDACYWYQVGCFVGCEECTGVGKSLYPQDSDLPAGCTPSAPTNNDLATRSWNPKDESVQGDWTKWNPWRSPGGSRGGPVRHGLGLQAGCGEGWSHPRGLLRVGKGLGGAAAWERHGVEGGRDGRGRLVDRGAARRRLQLPPLPQEGRGGAHRGVLPGQPSPLRRRDAHHPVQRWLGQAL